jgi:hypothetical protein
LIRSKNKQTFEIPGGRLDVHGEYPQALQSTVIGEVPEFLLSMISGDWQQIENARLQKKSKNAKNLQNGLFRILEGGKA